jgi:hypothetical protein
MEDQSQSNDYERNGPTSSGESSTVHPQLTMLMPMQKMPITPNPVIFVLAAYRNLSLVFSAIWHFKSHVLSSSIWPSYSISISALFNWSFADAKFPAK